MSLNGLAAFAPAGWFRMGQVIPQAPALQGRPKPTPPKVRPRQPEHPCGHGPFKCRYCGRYGQPGACEGCGAPNAPVIADAPLPPRRPDTIMRFTTVNETRQLFGLPTIPEFDTVKR